MSENMDRFDVLREPFFKIFSDDLTPSERVMYRLHELGFRTLAWSMANADDGFNRNAERYTLRAYVLKGDPNTSAEWTITLVDPTGEHPDDRVLTVDIDEPMLGWALVIDDDADPSAEFNISQWRVVDVIDNRPPPNDKCPDCEGRGWALFERSDNQITEVECCDTCDRFDSDIEAGRQAARRFNEWKGGTCPTCNARRLCHCDRPQRS